MELKILPETDCPTIFAIVSFSVHFSLHYWQVSKVLWHSIYHLKEFQILVSLY